MSPKPLWSNALIELSEVQVLNLRSETAGLWLTTDRSGGYSSTLSLPSVSKIHLYCIYSGPAGIPVFACRHPRYMSCTRFIGRLHCKSEYFEVSGLFIISDDELVLEGAWIE